MGFVVVVIVLLVIAGWATFCFKVGKAVWEAASHYSKKQTWEEKKVVNIKNTRSMSDAELEEITNRIVEQLKIK